MRIPLYLKMWLPVLDHCKLCEMSADMLEDQSIVTRFDCRDYFVFSSSARSCLPPCHCYSSVPEVLRKFKQYLFESENAQ